MMSDSRFTVSQPFPSCPVCHYALTGLPQSSDCPECGFELNKATQAWSYPISQLPFRIGLILLGAFLTFTTLDQLTFGIVKPLATSAYRRVFLAAGLVLISAIVAFVLFRTRGSVRLIVGDQEFWLVHLRRITVHMPWSDVWIPDPSEKRPVPPWVQAQNARLDHAGFVRRILFRERLTVPDRFAVYPRQGTARFRANPGISLPIRALPRKTRAKVMQEIYDLWTIAHQKCQHDPP